LSRNFHQALLVGAELQTLPEPDYDQFTRLAFYADLTPPPRLELRKTRPQPFLDPQGEQQGVTHPLTKAALAQLAQSYPTALAYTDLEAAARRQVAAQGDPRLAAQGEQLFGELFKLFAEGLVRATPVPGGTVPGAGELPRASALAQAEAARGRLVDRRHQSLRIEDSLAGFIALLDGRHGRDELIRALPPPAGARRTPSGGTTQELDNLLARLARLGLFQT
jgi:hypothetical protein